MANLNYPQLSFNQTYQWTDAVLISLRNAVQNLGFQEIVPALLSKSFEPGANHSVAVMGNKCLPSLYKKDNHEGVCVSGHQSFYLPVSHVVEKQMALEHLSKVYCLAPCLRLVMDEEDTSGKHLYNFFQFEIEWRTDSMDEVFSTGEKILVSAAKNLLSLAKQNLSLVILPEGEKHLQAIAKGQYPVITFAEALKLIGKEGHVGDLTPADDQALSMKFDTPFWIYDYPEGVRDSIYHKNSRGSYDTYDLMLPFGYGELTTGGIRPKTAAEIIEQSAKLGKSYSSYYADWKDRTNIQTAGFGIGLERLLRFICGAASILDFVQYHDNGPNNIIQREFTDCKRAEQRNVHHVTA